MNDMGAMTEEEAKQRWCPFARTVEAYTPQEGHSRPRNRVVAFNGNTPNGNALAAKLIGCKCIASECMAWRWAEDVCRHKENGSLHTLDAMDPKSSTADQYERMPSRGFCGLAGTPG